MTNSVVCIVSGGQAGADQAGLLAAQMLDIKTGGWAAQNWMTEDGPARWLKDLGLKEGGTYAARTRMNVRDSDGTVLFGKITSAGSVWTSCCIREFKKPNLHFDVPWNMDARVKYMRDWLAKYKIKTLNVAGNRESVNPGIGAMVVEMLVEVLGAT